MIKYSPIKRDIAGLFFASSLILIYSPLKATADDFSLILKQRELYLQPNEKNSKRKENKLKLEKTDEVKDNPWSLKAHYDSEHNTLTFDNWRNYWNKNVRQILDFLPFSLEARYETEENSRFLREIRYDLLDRRFDFCFNSVRSQNGSLGLRINEEIEAKIKMGISESLDVILNSSLGINGLENYLGINYSF